MQRETGRYGFAQSAILAVEQRRTTVHCVALRSSRTRKEVADCGHDGFRIATGDRAMSINRSAFAVGAGATGLSALATDFVYGEPFIGILAALTLATLAKWSYDIKSYYAAKEAENR